MTKNHLLSDSKSTKGFVLIYILAYFLFFTTFISILMLQKELSIKQSELYKEAEIKIQTEKMIFKTILNHKDYPLKESININGHLIEIEYGDTISVRICGSHCYTMNVIIDSSVQMIVNVSYE